jgi:metallo-beta-lactamase class B
MNRLLLSAVLCGCVAAPPAVEQPRDVSFSPLAAGVWRYEVRTNDRHQVLPANGLLIATPEGPVLVDSGWRADQAAALIEFSEQTLHQPPVLVVVTHSHSDRSGGLAEVRRRGLRVGWLQHTAELVSDVLDSDLRFTDAATFGGVELFFPGAGHAPDNIVVWHAATKTLYGGCFIKALESDIGWLHDADLAAWPSSLDHVLARYPAIENVVPGHGAPGGVELIEHTRALVAEQVRAKR